VTNKIVSVDSIGVYGGSRNWVFVIVTTTEGITGVGEATLEWHTNSVLAAIEEMSHLVVGQDAARIQHLWQSVYRRRFWRGGPVLLSALSGLEQALWDIKGKVAGLPVYELLGGACRDRLLLYANHPEGLTPNEIAADLKSSGLTGVKITPFPDTALIVDGRAPALRHAIDETAAIREVVGPDVRIAIDVHGRLSPSMSIVFARAVEPFDVWFLEEPGLPEDPGGLREVARATTIPVAGGERILTRSGFWELLADRAVAMVQPDLAHCGGIFEGRVIAAMAESRQIGFAPHNPMSMVNTMASAHVSLTAPNFVTLEHKVGDAPWHREAIVSNAFVQDGYLHLSADPGLGVELDLDVCSQHPVVEIPVKDVRHHDGSVADR
jgi:galactonate dehydratase